MRDKFYNELQFLTKNNPDYAVALVKKIKHSQVKQNIEDDMISKINEKSSKYFIDNFSSLELSPDNIQHFQKALLKSAPDMVLGSLDKLGLSSEKFVEIAIIENYEYLSKNITNFNLSPEQKSDLIDRCIINGKIDNIFTNLAAFGISENELVDRAIDKNADSLIDHLGRKGISADQKEKIISKVLNIWKPYGGSHYVENLIKVLSPEDLEKIKDTLIRYHFIAVLKFSDKLNLKPEEIKENIHRFIQRDPETAFENLQKLAVTQEEFAELLIIYSPKKVPSFLSKLTISPEQQNRLIDELTNQYPADLLRDLDKLTLSPEQQNNLIDALIQKHPAELLNYIGKIYIPHDQMSRLVDKLIEQTPSILLQHLKDFAFSQKQRNDLIENLIKKNPIAMLSALKKLSLSLEQQNTLINKLIQEDPLELLNNLGKLPPSPEQQKQLAEAASKTSMKKLFSYPQVLASLAWEKPVIKLRDIQDFSANENHCPWTKEIQPLLKQMTDENRLSLEKTEDGEMFLSFIKEFGAFNMPLLCGSYVELKKITDLSELEPNTRKNLEEAVGSLEKFKTPDGVINEIRNFKRKLQQELLRDKIPAKIDTALGIEVLGALKGTTKWAGMGSMSNLINVWRKTAAEIPQLAELPEGYEEKPIEISETEAIKISDEEKNTRENALLENKTLQAMFENLRDAMKEGSKIEDVNGYWQGQKELIKGTLSEKLEKARAKLSEVPDKANKGIQKSIENLENTLSAVEGLEIKKDASEEEVVQFMSDLADIKEAKNALQVMSAFHLKKIIPDGWRSHFDSLAAGEGEATKQDISQMSDLLLQFINEHYLHPEQKQHHAYHSPFSNKLRKTLEDVWQTREDPAKHLIHQTNAQLQQISEQGKITKKKTEIALVSAKGLLRVFSGDIGDACYTSQHDMLAKGEFPGITSINIVTNRNKAQERIDGSVLFIETKTPDGKKVLNIRANNPRENLLGRVNGDALIKEIIKYAKETAQRRKIDIVALPLDGASHSSSNRPTVSAYYQKNFSKNKKVELVNEPETNFNNYSNWNPDGKSPVVAIWNKRTFRASRKYKAPKIGAKAIKKIKK
ncbi:MAG: hypothetical protein ACOZBH_04280 [Patescibacteria group bacterium]